MHKQTLLQSFNNKNTTTEKKRDKEQIPKRKKKIGNNIYQCDIVCQILKWKTIKNDIQKKGDKRIEIECLRTVTHGGYTGHRPVRNITIER